MPAVNSNQERQFRWPIALFFLGTTLGTLIFVPLYIAGHGFNLGLAAFFFACYVISNMSITCGYHRYFSHRSYNAHPFIEWLYIIIGSGAFQGSILQWCTDHRRHHREVDSDEDPYSISKGFWFAHMGWMLTKDTHPESGQYAKDLQKNHWIVWQHRYYPLFAFGVGFGLPALAGWALGFGAWAGFLFGGVARTVVSQHSTFFINSLCHCWGRQPYTNKNSARDSFLMAVATFGEGYHNYHHLFQADYRNGVRWYQFDPTKWWIRSLALVGLADRLKRASREEILKARLAMEESLLIARGASHDRVNQLKARVMETQARLKELKASYLQHKRDKSLRRMIRAEIKMAKLEFSSAYGQWRIFTRSLLRMKAAA